MLWCPLLLCQTFSYLFQIKYSKSIFQHLHSESLKNLHMRLAWRLAWYDRYFRFCAMPKKAIWIFVKPQQKIGQTSFVQISMWFFQFVFGVMSLGFTMRKANFKFSSSELSSLWNDSVKKQVTTLSFFRKKENKNQLHHIEVPEHDMISIEKVTHVFISDEVYDFGLCLNFNGEKLNIMNLYTVIWFSTAPKSHLCQLTKQTKCYRWQQSIRLFR